MQTEEKVEIGTVIFISVLLIAGCLVAYANLKPPVLVGSHASYLPDASLTPGSLNPDINQSNIKQNICNPKWSTKSIRPSSSYTTQLKKQQLMGYHSSDGKVVFSTAGGYINSDTNLADYEEDHLISLELGGDPTDQKNLWAEPYTEPYGARDKDKVENYLHAQVCNGNMSLQKAQKLISTDWTVVYNDINQKLGGIISSQDNDDE